MNGRNAKEQTQDDLFGRLFERVTREESRSFVPYSIPEFSGIARMHQNECYLPEESLAQLSSEFAEVLRCHWTSCQGQGPNLYPSLRPLRLREAYADYLQRPVTEVEVFSGSSEALYTLASGCFRRGARVAFMNPSFSLLSELVQLWGARAVGIELNGEMQVEEHELLKPEVLEAEVVILCQPNNPTGTVLDPKWIEELLRRAQGLVVVDEAYFEFHRARDSQLVSWVTRVPEFANLVVLRTLSKAWGVAGLRVGAMVAQKRWIEFFAGLRRPYSIPQPSEVLGAHVLWNKRDTMESLVKRVVRECAHLEDRLRERVQDDASASPFSLHASGANFVVMRASPEWSLRLAQSLQEQGVLARVFPSGLIRVNPWSGSANERFITLVEEMS